MMDKGKLWQPKECYNGEETGGTQTQKQAFTFLSEEQHEGLCDCSGMSYKQRLGDNFREMGRMGSLWLSGS